MIKTKEIQKLPESYKKFEIKFKANIERLNKTKETIFESALDTDKISQTLIEEHYGYFVRNYLNEYNENNRDSSIMLKSIQESYNQSIFNKIIDAVIVNGTISYSHQILLENTVEKCNVSLENVGKEYLVTESLTESYTPTEKNQDEEFGSIQENVFGLVASGAAGLAGAGVVGALGIGAVASFAASLLVPSKHMDKISVWLGNTGSFVFRAITGQLNYLNNSYTYAANMSRNIHINFDNIDADPVVINLFKKMQKTSILNSDAAKKEAQNGLTTIVAQCVDQNKNIFDIANDDVTSALFKNPKNYNLFKMFWKSTIGNANSDKKDHDTLLRFRKCLSNKLVDVYKLLLISNLQNRNDHKRITDAVSKINSGRPELILQFLPKETPEDEKLQEAILALVQFRIHLWNLSKDLQNGMFDIDREAGKFLQQKLTSVDSEVESFLRLNQHKWAPKEENPNAKQNTFQKRTFLSKQSSL